MFHSLYENKSRLNYEIYHLVVETLEKKLVCNANPERPYEVRCMHIIDFMKFRTFLSRKIELSYF